MKTKFNKETTGWVKAAIIGIAVAVIISVVLTALTAHFVLNEKVGESSVSLILFVVRFLSAGIGGLVGTSLSKEKLLPVIGVITGGYLLVLLATGIIFFDGSFHQFGSGLISVLSGGAGAGAIRLKPAKNKSRGVRVGR